MSVWLPKCRAPPLPRPLCILSAYISLHTGRAARLPNVTCNCSITALLLLAWAGRPRHAASSAASAPPSPSAAPWARCCKCSASAPPKTPVHSECLHKSTYWSCCPTAQCDMQLLHHCSSLARMGWAASSCSSVCRLGSSLSIGCSLCQVLQVLRQRNRQIGELDVAGLQLVLLEVLGRALV
jgi:hypothetical protein